MAKQSKEMTVKKLSVPALKMPTGIKTKLSQMDSKKLPIPMLRLTQSMSDSVKAKELEPGVYENSISGETYEPAQDWIFLDVSQAASYYIRGQGVKCKSDDSITNQRGESCSSCPYGVYWDDWGADGKTPPKCALVYNFLIVKRDTLTTGAPEVLGLSMRKTSAKVARKILATLKNDELKGLLPFARAWSFGVSEESNGEDTWHQFKVRASGFVTQDELDRCAKLWEGFAGRVSEVQNDDDI